jgi:hypothetical protein
MTITDPRPADLVTVPRLHSLAEPDSPAASVHATPNVVAPQGPDSRAAEEHSVPMVLALREPNSHATIHDEAAAGARASRGPNSRPARVRPTPDEQAPDGAQLSDRRSCADSQTSHAIAVDEAQDRAAEGLATPEVHSLLDPALALAADFLDDVERVKIANENRLRALTRVGPTRTGSTGTSAWTSRSPSGRAVRHDGREPRRSRARRDAEPSADGAQAPARPVDQGAKGVGEKQGARLLAVIGDPYWRPEITREDGTVIPEGPRTVSALWAYCGLHVLPGWPIAHRRPCDLRRRGSSWRGR